MRGAEPLGDPGGDRVDPAGPAGVDHPSRVVDGGEAGLVRRPTLGPEAPRQVDPEVRVHGVILPVRTRGTYSAGAGE
ncbi:hypothetical protein [Curtobacterium sp. MCJR17_043]|uniref:hypothetical protein n=1 Tax=Curtobacterium sp. MCJR17_043 TaxID=2175660 RepID=UPI0024DF4168|nr:hypothetical protein [Curtobacterium sp. MCJR17_043]WIB36982.1 hypothetical protein DEJ15_08595 [Curtobacterium sp. MCJR17_043]